MSYLRHIALCNQFDPDRFLPFLLDGHRVGLIRRDRLPVLGERPDLFVVTDRSVALAASIIGTGRISDALLEFSQILVERGLIPALRREPFAVTRRWGTATLFQVDRGAVPFFGTRSYGVHLNGLRVRDGSELWIGKRAQDKRVAPGKLDNMVAGGISAGYDARQTLAKEAAEEAGMTAELASLARPTGAILYRMEVAEGVRDDVLLVYDIELPASFEPRNTDGEFESFSVMSLESCLRRVAETDDFKFNVNLVLIDLAIRHGFIGPDHPEFLELVEGLRRKSGERANFGG